MADSQIGSLTGENDADRQLQERAGPSEPAAGDFTSFSFSQTFTCFFNWIESRKMCFSIYFLKPVTYGTDIISRN